MSIQHRHRAVRDRAEARVERGKRLSLPAEYERSSEQPPVPHERPAASTRDFAPGPAPKPAKPVKPVKKRKRKS